MHQRRQSWTAVVALALAGSVHGCAAGDDPSAGGRGGRNETGGTGGASAGGGESGSGGAAGNFMNAGGTSGGTSTTSGAGGGMLTGGTSALPTPDGGVPFDDMCNPSALMPAKPETCGNGLDDNLNGFIDELDEATGKTCSCTLGQSQPCFGGRPWDADRPNCKKGTQKCEGPVEFAGWGKCTDWNCDDVTPPAEICWDMIDNDCDATVDEGCVLDVPVDIMGDCVEASCPPQAPFPVGCDLNMMGGDSRGCVAVAPGASTVYFKEGDLCPLIPGLGDTGHIVGTLLCGVEMRDPLDATNCTTMKSDPSYPTDKSGCAGN